MIYLCYSFKYSDGRKPNHELQIVTYNYSHFLEVSSNLLVKLTLKEMLDTMVVVVTTPVG